MGLMLIAPYKCRVVSARSAGIGNADSQSTKATNNIEALALFEGEWMTFSPWIIRFRTCLTEDRRPRAFGPLAGEFWYCLHVFDLWLKIIKKYNLSSLVVRIHTLYLNQFSK